MINIKHAYFVKCDLCGIEEIIDILPAGMNLDKNKLPNGWIRLNYNQIREVFKEMFIDKQTALAKAYIEICHECIDKWGLS